MSQKPTIGRIVQYCIGHDGTGAVYRPAIIVNDRGGNFGESGGVNLQVFLDGLNDARFLASVAPDVESERGTAWRTSVTEGPNFGQWRWPPRESATPLAPSVEPPAPKAKGLTFGEALQALKEGKRVAREGWNGKGMWIALTPGSTTRNEDVRAGAARELAQENLRSLESARAKGHAHLASQCFVRIGAHIDMRAADGSLVIGWLASQTDMLAEDWVVLA